MSEDPVTFLASFPPIQSAIKIDGQGGARIQLDIPESEMGNFIKAMTWRGKQLLVTIETAEPKDKLDYRGRLK
jgi:hypothetical protein